MKATGRMAWALLLLAAVGAAACGEAGTQPAEGDVIKGSGGVAVLEGPGGGVHEGERLAAEERGSDRGFQRAAEVGRGFRWWW